MPEIFPVDTEREILLSRLYDAISSRLQLPAPAAAMISPIAVTEMIRALRVLSARQLAVLLAEEANRHEVRVIHEPPRYTTEEQADHT